MLFSFVKPAILCLFIMSFVMCKTPHIANRNNVIVYKVFDSLEMLLCKKIELLGDNDSVFIMIEPAGDFRSRLFQDQQKEDRYIYNLSIFKKYQYKRDSIFNISNRKIEICGKLYGVFFLRVDDVFRSTEKNRNKAYADNIFTESMDLYNHSYYKVDMMRKKVIFSSFIEK